MQNFEPFHRLSGRASSCPETILRRLSRGLAETGSRSRFKHVRRTHSAEILNQPIEAVVGNLHRVDIDDRHGKPACRQQPGKRRRFEPRMDVRRGAARLLVGSTHRRAEPWQRVASCDRADEQRIRLQRKADTRQCRGKVVDAFKRADRDTQVVAADFEVHAVFDNAGACGRSGEPFARVDCHHFASSKPQSFLPVRIGTAKQQGAVEASPDERQAVQYIRERAFMQEEFGPRPGSPVTPERALAHIEQFPCHAAACAPGGAARQAVAMEWASVPKAAMNRIVDFALPPRCGGCGEIVEQVHSFCPGCWSSLQFLGDSGCKACGIPLEATEADLCGACIASPPRIARTRAAVAYDEVARGLAIRLKYGRKVALARTMARYMLPLLPDLCEAPLLVPVPLHRSRLWERGFNQSALIARELSRKSGIALDAGVLRRNRRTPPLKGLTLRQRRRTVAGAFTVTSGTRLDGRSIVLIDDVLTTGSTANACARALKGSGARRVELVTWARVLKPVQVFS